MKRLVLLCLIPLCFSGCATIISGTTQPLTFQSVPNGATVLIDNVPVGKTPLSLNVKRSSSLKVLIKKEGYEDQAVAPKTKITGAFWGNVLFGGFFGSTTDTTSGASNEYAPDQYFVTLVPTEQISATIKKTNETESDRRSFILSNQDSIGKDLLRGNGEFLDVLYSQFNVSASKKGAALSKLKTLYSDSTSREAFADSVITEFSNPVWKE